MSKLDAKTEREILARSNQAQYDYDHPQGTEMFGELLDRVQREAITVERARPDYKSKYVGIGARLRNIVAEIDLETK